MSNLAIRECADEQTGRTRHVSSVIVAAHVGCPDLALLDDLVRCLRDVVRIVVESEMSEHHGSGEDHGDRVGDVLCRPDVSATSRAEVHVRRDARGQRCPLRRVGIRAQTAQSSAQDSLCAPKTRLSKGDPGGLGRAMTHPGTIPGPPTTSRPSIVRARRYR